MILVNHLLNHSLSQLLIGCNNYNNYHRLGGYDGDKQYEDILEFRSGEWIKLDKMLQGRFHHAVSVLSVPIQDICVLKT